MGALEQGVPCDFVEAGTFTGAMTILMLKALSDYDPHAHRRMWAADSFQDLPNVVEQDKGRGSKGEFATTRAVFNEAIDQATKELGLTRLAERLHVLEGWFKDTLPSAPIESIALLRMDGDIYVSTRDTLMALYDKVSPGGLIYVDDYGSFQGCKTAVDEFRQQHGIRCPLLTSALPEQGAGAPGKEVAWESAWWIKCTEDSENDPPPTKNK